MPLTRTNIAAVIVAIRERLIDVLRFPPERVIPDARDDDEDDYPTQADQYVLLRPGNGPPDSKLFDGAGRNALVLTREITCTLWTRLATDDQRSDEQWLLNASLGHFAREHQLWDALAGFQPLDDAGNWLVKEPIQPAPVTAPRKARKRKGWGRSGVRFSVSYVLDLDLTYQ